MWKKLKLEGLHLNSYLRPMELITAISVERVSFGIKFMGEHRVKQYKKNVLWPKGGGAWSCVLTGKMPLNTHTKDPAPNSKHLFYCQVVIIDTIIQ